MVFSALGPNLLGASPSRNPASSATNNDTSVDESRELEKQCVIIICEEEVNKFFFENNNNSNDESYEIDSDKLEEIQEILDKHGFTVTVAELAQEISVLKKCHHVFLTICIAKSFSSFGKCFWTFNSLKNRNGLYFYRLY